MPLHLASLTAPLVNLATHLIADIGLAGVALLTLSSGVIGVPEPRVEPVSRSRQRRLYRGTETALIHRAAAPLEHERGS